MHPHPRRGRMPYRPAGVPDTPAFCRVPQMDMVKNLLKLFPTAIPAERQPESAWQTSCPVL